MAEFNERHGNPDTDPRFGGDFRRGEGGSFIPSNGPDFYNSIQLRANFFAEEQIRRAAVTPDLSVVDFQKDRSFGHYIKPTEDSLWGYKSALHERHDTQFNSLAYPGFDGIIVKHCGVDDKGRSNHPAFNPASDYYSNYAPLRRNLAIVRNHMMNLYPPEGKDKDHNIEILQTMGDKIGLALSGGLGQPMMMERLAKNLGRMATLRSPSIPNTTDFLESANVPDRGASLLYSYLEELPKHPGFKDAIAFDHAPREWNLKPLDKSPFSVEQTMLDGRGVRMERVVKAMDAVTAQFYSVDTLSDKDRRISVEEAHNILEKLRIRMGNGTDARYMNVLDPKTYEAQQILQGALCLRGTLAQVARLEPEWLKGKELDMPGTMEALEKINYRLKEQLLGMYKEEGRLPADIKKLEAHLAEVPERYRSKEPPLDTLLQKLQNGLTEANRLEKALANGATRQSTSAPMADDKRIRSLNEHVAAAHLASLHAKAARDAMQGGRNTMSKGIIPQVNHHAFTGDAERINNMPEPEVKQGKNNNGGGPGRVQ